MLSRRRLAERVPRGAIEMIAGRLVVVKRLLDGRARKRVDTRASSGRRKIGQRAAPVLVILAIAGVSSVTAWTRPVNWTDPDSLFYQAQALEVRGVPRYTALRSVFEGPLGTAARTTDRHHHASNPSWIRYASRFYRRRWVVPTLAAALSPLFRDRSLQVVSVLGYFSIGVLVYLLLRRRFSVGISGLVVAVCLWIPPLRWYGLSPFTDSWGLALVLAALIAALAVVEKGISWLPLWVAVLAVMSLTREDAIVVVVAACWLVLSAPGRRRRASALALAGVIVSLPAALFLAAPLAETMAYALHYYEQVRDPTWGFILHHYAWGLRNTLRGDLLLPHISNWPLATTVLWYIGLGIAVAVSGLILARRSDDLFFKLMQGSVLGGAALIAVGVNYTAYRLELVFLPAVAVGLALVAEGIVTRLRTNTPPRAHHFAGRLPAISSRTPRGF